MLCREKHENPFRVIWAPILHKDFVAMVWRVVGGKHKFKYGHMWGLGGDDYIDNVVEHLWNVRSNTECLSRY